MTGIEWEIVGPPEVRAKGWRNARGGDAVSGQRLGRTPSRGCMHSAIYWHDNAAGREVVEAMATKHGSDPIGNASERPAGIFQQPAH
jgi:hypothetical protein